jgi:hypothetical protein
MIKNNILYYPNPTEGGGGKGPQGPNPDDIKKVTKEQDKQINQKQKLSELEAEIRERGFENVQIQRDLTDEVKILTKEIYGSTQQAGEMNKAFRDMSQMTRTVSQNWLDIMDGTKKVEDIEKDIVKQGNANNRLQTEQNLLLSKAGIAQKDLQFNKKGELEISANMLKSMSNLTDKEKELLILTAETLNLNKENLAILEAQQKKLEDANTGLVKGLGAASEVMGKIGLGEFAGPLKKGAEAARMAALEGKGFAGQMAAAGTAIKAAVAPLMIIATIMAGFKFDEQSTEFQKNMGLSKMEAVGLRQELAMASNATGDMAINAERTIKAFNTIQEQMGIAVRVSGQMATEAAVLQEKWGLSNEAIGNFAKASYVTGKSIEDQKLDVVEITEQYRAQTGIAFKHKDIMDKVGKVTGTIRAQMQGSTKAIAEAILESQRLGLELEEVANIASGLLNFEQSIEAELEAELLTGKQLNLEKARMYALTGDYAALAKQVGSWKDYTSMNVLQQEALAKSMNMTRDQMADMLFQQESMGKSAEQLRAEGKHEMAAKIEARNLQEEMNDAVMKLKGIFVDLVGGPLGMMLELVVMILEPINWIAEAMGKVFSLFTDTTEEMSAWEVIVGSLVAGITTIWVTMKAIKAIQMGLKVIEGIRLGYNAAMVGYKYSELALEKKGLAKSIGRAVFKAIQSLSSIPVIGWALGLAAAGVIGTMGAMYLAKGEKGGYIGGKRHSEGGTIIEAEQGEFIMSRKGVAEVGLNNLYAMNKGGGIIGGGQAEEGGEVGSPEATETSTQVIQVRADAYEMNNVAYRAKMNTHYSKFNEV